MNRSVMRATSIALACSTEIRFGFLVALGASAGASITARAVAASGFVITVILRPFPVCYSAGTVCAAEAALPSFLARYSR